jgi:hypothetical protein
MFVHTHTSMYSYLCVNVYKYTYLIYTDNPRMPTLCGCGENRAKFHYPCLLLYLEKKRSCPVCSQDLYYQVHIYIHIYIYLYKYIEICMYLYEYTYVFIHIYICIYIYIYIYMYITVFGRIKILSCL